MRVAALMVIVALAAPAATAQSWLERAKKAVTGEEAPAVLSDLTDGEIEAGLREALRVGTERVVDRLSLEDGFNGDADIHIPLPRVLQRVGAALERVGAGHLADDLELRLNRAAEAATPAARQLFVDAIAGMTLEDVRAILAGPQDAATQYFRTHTAEGLRDAMRPIIDGALSDVGAVAQLDTLLAEYKALPFVPDVKADLTGHVLERGLDGLFLYVAREEAAIRADPAKRTTQILKSVFGSEG